MKIVNDGNVRKKLGENIYNVQRDFIDSLPDENYNDFYTGIVEDNNDPDKMGKCKIRVLGLFDNAVSTEDLPWCIPEFHFLGSKIGSFIVPPINAKVKVYFDDGDIYRPHYISKAISNDQISQLRLNDYPNNMVFFETDNGDSFTINRKTSETKFHHKSGLDIEISKNGSVNITGTQGGNSLTMDSTGVKINGQYLVTEKFLTDLLTTYAATLGLGNLGAPVPIFPTTLTGMQAGKQMPDGYLTRKL